jgi:hypothetical protein
LASVITDEYVAALRAFLTGDGTYERLSEYLQARDGQLSGDHFSALTGMALCTAARRRFPAGYTNADVIRLVGQVRGRAGDPSDNVDPLVAEAVLRGALGDAAAAENLDQAAMAMAIPALLLILLEQNDVADDEGVDSFLADIRPLADAWLARRR